MSKYLVLNIFLFSSALFSQTMNIHTKDGSVTQHNLSEIDSITFSASEEIQFLVNDNFDSYDSNIFPSSGGWTLGYNGAGDSYQIITNLTSHSNPQSMQLKGKPSWGALMYFTLPETPSVVFCEGYIKTPISLSSDSYDVCTIGFENFFQGTWGTGYSIVKFDNQTGEIICGIFDKFKIVQNYNSDQWYKVKIKFDVINENMDVWINDVLVLQGFSQTLPSEGYSEFFLHAGHGNSLYYFDDVKVWYED